MSFNITSSYRQFIWHFRALHFCVIGGTSCACSSFVHRDWKSTERGTWNRGPITKTGLVYLDQAIYFRPAIRSWKKHRHPHLSRGEPCEKWTRQCNQFYSVPPRRFKTRNSISRRKKKIRFAHCCYIWLDNKSSLEVAQVTNPSRSTRK